MPEDTNLDKARRYLQAIEKGNAAYVLSLLSPEAYIDQLPNKIYPQGSRARVFQIPEAFEKGRQIFAHQTYQILNDVTNGNTVVLEVVWTGKLAIAFGTLSAGAEMRANSAMFIEFRDGKIVAQRNYDCFEPW